MKTRKAFGSVVSAGITVLVFPLELWLRTWNRAMWEAPRAWGVLLPLRILIAHAAFFVLVIPGSGLMATWIAGKSGLTGFHGWIGVGGALLGLGAVIEIEGQGRRETEERVESSIRSKVVSYRYDDEADMAGAPLGLAAMTDDFGQRVLDVIESARGSRHAR